MSMSRHSSFTHTHLGIAVLSSCILLATCTRPPAPHDESGHIGTPHDGAEAGKAQARDTELSRATPSPASPTVDPPHEAKAAAPSATSSGTTGGSVGSSTGAGGLGLSGIGEGGGGYGVGSGRLSGSHASKRYAVRGGSAAVASGESYAHVGESSFVDVKTTPLSTFSVDVDTASYSNSRRFLQSGSLPPRDAIRVEEWLNYFAYDYPKPAANQPFSVTTEVTAAPWNAQHRLVRIGLRGVPLAAEEIPARNLVFLLDVSGSMASADKLPLVKKGLALLVDQLRAEDTLSIVVYAGASGLVLPPTSGRERGKILGALENLEAGGSTNGGDGIRLAYSVASRAKKTGGINRVILATDGDFNVGTTSEGELERLIESERKTGVFLTVLGFGTGNVKDSTMEKLADVGNGNYAYVDSELEAKKVLVREAGATLATIAKDVKLQVEFNPRLVQSYRLIGYENRRLATQDFDDDKKDAGEIGSDHRVTALYEVVPRGEPSPASPPTALKYQGEGAPSAAAAAPELLTVNLRYKKPNEETSSKFSVVVPDRVLALAAASVDTRFAVAVAEAALVLGGSTLAQGASLGDARARAAAALGSDPHGDRREFVALLDRARSLTDAGAARAD